MGVPDAGGVVDAEVHLQPPVPVEELQDGHLDSREAPLGDTNIDQHLGVNELYPALDEVAAVSLQQPPALGQPLLVRHTGALGEYKGGAMYKVQRTKNKEQRTKNKE